MREIDITKEPINCIDELIIDEEKRSIEATYELWMDVDCGWMWISILGQKQEMILLRGLIFTHFGISIIRLK